MLVWPKQPERDGPRSGRPLRSCEEVRLLSRTMGSHSRDLSRGMKLGEDLKKICRVWSGICGARAFRKL